MSKLLYNEYCIKYWCLYLNYRKKLQLQPDKTNTEKKWHEKVVLVSKKKITFLLFFCVHFVTILLNFKVINFNAIDIEIGTYVHLVCNVCVRVLFYFSICLTIVLVLFSYKWPQSHLVSSKCSLFIVHTHQFI